MSDNVWGDPWCHRTAGCWRSRAAYLQTCSDMTFYTNVIKLTSENGFSMIIYRLLTEMQIIFLPIFSHKFVVKCAANILKIVWQLNFLGQKVLLNKEFAWPREIIQNLKLWILAKFSTGFRSFGIRRVFQNIRCWFQSFFGKKVKTFRIFRGKMTSPACYLPKQNSLFKNIFGRKSFICKPIFIFFAAHFTTNLELVVVGKNSLPPAKQIKILPEKSFSEVSFNISHSKVKR